MKKKSDVFFEKVEPLLKATQPYIVVTKEFDWSFISDSNKRAVDVALSEMGACVRAFFELHTVYSNMLLTLQISRRYPWRNGRPISRAQHLGFSWFQHVNLCYMFKEKYKLSTNRANNLMGMFEKPYRVDIAGGLKSIDAALGGFIRSRGQHMHEWDTEHQSIKFFSLIEFIHQHSKSNPPSPGAVKAEYQVAKALLVSDIKLALSFMETFLIDALDGYISEVVTVIEDFNKALDGIKSGVNLKMTLSPRKSS